MAGGGGPDGPEFDVFISYARVPDLERVRQLTRCLEAAGLAVWLDETAMESFEDITDGIARGLGRVRAVLVYGVGVRGDRAAGGPVARRLRLRHGDVVGNRPFATLSLAEPDDESDAWTVHPLISRTPRLHDPNPPRRAEILAALLRLAA